jgi:predicted Zn-ribbon and HTH transcriptional regulator
MIDPQSYLSFGEINYNLRDDELIILESLLTQEYFENLIPIVENKYVKQNSYDEVNPINTLNYDNTIHSLDEAIGKHDIGVCIKTANPHIKSSLWKKCFPENYHELEYTSLHSCTYEIIIDILKAKTGKTMTVNNIKNELNQEYNKYIVNHLDKIVDILILEGKKTLGDQARAKTLNFSTFIYTDNYFLTPFDLWVLVTKYKIPTIFVSQKPFLLTNNKTTSFVGYSESMDDEFAFIVVPGLRSEHIPNYKLVLSERGMFHSFQTIVNEDSLVNLREALDNKVSIEEYLLAFHKPKKVVYARKKFILVDDDIREEGEDEVEIDELDELDELDEALQEDDFIDVHKLKADTVIKENKKKNKKELDIVKKIKEQEQVEPKEPNEPDEPKEPEEKEQKLPPLEPEEPFPVLKLKGKPKEKKIPIRQTKKKLKIISDDDKVERVVPTEQQQSQLQAQIANPGEKIVFKKRKYTKKLKILNDSNGGSKKHKSTRKIRKKYLF